MSEDILRLLILAIVAVLIIVLIFRIKLHIRHMIKNEIYANFPSIKNKIEDFAIRVDFLKTKVDDLERRIIELRKKKQDINS
ncbi:MAG: hypothetical protein PHN57_03095 [Candidatus Omnitrophica bacterium]|nr:hypothetical protein [Candidatus Omnitrophota bacterium]